jgi:GMP synthase (glutamine-hydrolysing)
MTYDEIEISKLSKFNSFILSGRRSNDKEMNQLNSKIIKMAISEKKSLLGICYGAEIMGLTLGGTIRKTNSLQKGEQKIQVLQNNPLCTKEINVFESHHFELAKLPTTISTIAKSQNCEHELIQYQEFNIFGTQFHPEMTKDGQELIKQFCNLSQIS